MNISNKTLIILGLGVFFLTIVLSSIILSSGNFYIKNLGTSLEQNGMLLNSITVSGDGKVFANPDMVEISISVSRTAQTSEEALNQVNQNIERVRQILFSKNVPEEDITTSQLSIYTEYDWSRDSRIVLGQRATVGLTIKIKRIKDNIARASEVIDAVATVDNIDFSYINFDIEDKSEYFSKARELAFSKARLKAEELAKLSGVNLLKPVSISDFVYDISVPQSRNVMYDSMSPVSAEGAKTTLFGGELEVSVSLNVVWGID